MKILFVCRANVGRSQMAEAFFNKLSEKHKAVSAGTHVGDNGGKPINDARIQGDKIVEVMAEAGYDLSKNRRRQLTREMAGEAHRIIAICKAGDLPAYARNSPKTTFWNIEHAKNKSPAGRRKIRDSIKKLVEGLVKEIG